MFPILSGLIFLPIVGAGIILFLPQEKVRLIRRVALLTTALSLGLSISLLIHFNTQAGQAMQFVEKVLWIPGMNIWYFVGVDGLSAALVFLTALLGFIAALASGEITKRQKEYYALYLLLMTGMMGTFLALDFFLFYVFWEVVLIPMYFLIGIWGGPRREYAAIKFFLYTLAGSVLMLVAILAMYFKTAPHTFNMLEIGQASQGFDFRWQAFLFLAFYAAFAIKVPVFPFHTWLPDAHVEAPTPISVILAGVLLKMGTYGLVRICLPLFPQAMQYFACPLAILGMIGIVYGACVAMAQSDFKKMIAYSSVSHMGFVVLGVASLNATGLNGAILEMFNHGIITGGMFLLVGILYARAHTRELNQFGGLSAAMPVYAFFLTLCALASLGLPGLSGFVGEFLSLAGAFPGYKAVTIAAAFGLILTALYFLYMVQRVLLGKANTPNKYSDMNLAEIWSLIPLAVIMFVVGIYPEIILRFQETFVSAVFK